MSRQHSIPSIDALLCKALNAAQTKAGRYPTEEEEDAIFAQVKKERRFIIKNR